MQFKDHRKDSREQKKKERKADPKTDRHTENLIGLINLLSGQIRRAGHTLTGQITSEINAIHTHVNTHIKIYLYSTCIIHIKSELISINSSSLVNS